jgi:hypothetical protein
LGGEGAGQVGRDQLKDLLGPSEVLEVVCPQIPEFRTGGQLVSNQLSRRAREQDLAIMTGAEQAGDAAQRQPGIVLRLRGDHPGMQRHAHA